MCLTANTDAHPAEFGFSALPWAPLPARGARDAVLAARPIQLGRKCPDGKRGEGRSIPRYFAPRLK